MAGNSVSNIAITFGTNTAGVDTGIANLNAKLADLGQRWSAFATRAATLGAGAAAGFVGWGIKLAAEAQSAEAGFKTMLGSAEKAKKMLADIKQFAAETPLESGDLRQAAQTLLAFGVQSQEIIPTLRMLGDVSGGNAEKLKSLALTFGQISSTGKLMGQDLLQLIGQGFNPLQEMSRTTGRSMADLKKEMEKGNISFDMVVAAFKSATEEGGLFYKRLEEGSKTVEGQFSTLKDAVKDLAASVGEALLPAATKMVQAGAGLVEWAKGFKLETVKTAAQVVAFAVAFGAVLKLVPMIVSAFRTIITAYRALTTAQVIQQAMAGPAGWAALAAGAVIGAAAVVGVGMAFDSLGANGEQGTQKAIAGMNGLDAAADRATESVRATYAEIQAATDESGNSFERMSRKLQNFGLLMGENAPQLHDFKVDPDWGKVADLGKKLDSMKIRAEALGKSMRLPNEIYADAIAELEELNRAGLLTQEQFAKGRDKAAEAFKKSMDEQAAKTQAFAQAMRTGVGAATKGTMEGFSAVLQGDRENKVQADLLRKQLEQQKLATAALQDLKRIQEQKSAVSVKTVTL